MGQSGNSSSPVGPVREWPNLIRVIPWIFGMMCVVLFAFILFVAVTNPVAVVLAFELFHLLIELIQVIKS